MHQLGDKYREQSDKWLTVIIFKRIGWGVGLDIHRVTFYFDQLAMKHAFWSVRLKGLGGRYGYKSYPICLQRYRIGFASKALLAVGLTLDCQFELSQELQIVSVSQEGV